jgi:UMF1 family MFS transporter
MYSTRIKNAWAFYDWANSVYSLVISTAVFPLYYELVVRQMGVTEIELLGLRVIPSSLYAWCLSFSFFIIVILSPLLSGIADARGIKKRFMAAFALLGSTSCSLMYFFTPDFFWSGPILVVLASVGFWGSLVFYNGFLPLVAPVEDQDRLSAKGFSLGYLGSSLLLIGILAMIMKPTSFGLADEVAAFRAGFLVTGLWWIGFAQITLWQLPKEPRAEVTTSGFAALKRVWHSFADLPRLKTFLLAFFLVSLGVQTIILLASLFGSQELGLGQTMLIGTILIIQVLGIVGAFVFSRLSARWGNIRALTVSTAIWAGICVGAFLIRKGNPGTEVQFLVLAGVVGLVLGGIQALARSTYSKMLPPTTHTASYFSFFDITEKVAIVLGTLIYGAINQITGQMRYSALVLSLFFVAAWLVWRQLSAQLKRDALPGFELEVAVGDAHQNNAKGG